MWRDEAYLLDPSFCSKRTTVRDLAEKDVCNDLYDAFRLSDCGPARARWQLWQYCENRQ